MPLPVPRFRYITTLALLQVALQGDPLLYTGGLGDGKVYQIDTSTGILSAVTPSPVTVAGLNGIALSNLSTAYVVGTDGYMYQVNVENGNSSQFAHVASTNGLNGVCVLDGYAYTADFNSGTFYKVNLDTAAVSSFTTTPTVPNPATIQVVSPDLAYTVAFGNSGVYQLDLLNNQATEITTVPSAPADLTVLGTTGFVAGYYGDSIYQVDLVGGAVSTIATFTPATQQPTGVTVFDENTLYTVIVTNDYVYATDLVGYQTSRVNTNTISGAGFGYISFAPITPPPPSPSFIPTSGLHGNLLTLANYLNANAPSSVVALFSSQSDLAGALTVAAPIRNAIGTFISQTTQIALSQTVAGHLREVLFRDFPSKQVATSAQASRFTEGALLADAGNRLPSTPSLPTRGTYSPWIALFGEYSKEKQQSQTPAFTAGSGGFVAAFDYYGIDGLQPLGGGVAYAYSHVHEKGGVGHINVNQGYAVLYGSTSLSRWYWDFAVWGGYYHLANTRNVSFPGFEAKIRSTTHGWQLTPHLEIGYDHVVLARSGRWEMGMTPFAEIDWVSDWEHGLREKGSGHVLDFGQKGRWCSFLRTEEGLRFQEQAACSWGLVTIRETLSYVYQKAFATGKIDFFLVGSPSGFTLVTLQTAQNLGSGTFELIFTPNSTKYPYGSVRYQGQFGSKYQSQLVDLYLGWRF